MTPQAPPRWLEWVLLRFLPLRDRETVSGDLLEEYLEGQVPRLGPLRANFWYLRQSTSFALMRITGGPHVRILLLFASVTAAAAATWLAVMETILKHDGYGARSAVDVCIALQAVATVLYVILDGRGVFRVLLSAGAIAVGLVGVWAIKGILSARHFEGFVLLIGLNLLAQSTLTLIVLFQARYGRRV